MSSTQSPAQADQPKASPLSKLPPRRSWLIFLAIVFVNYLVMRFLFPGPPESITVPYTAFKEQVAKRNVAAIYSRGSSIEGRSKAAATWPPESAAKAPPDAKGLPQPAPRTADTFTTELPAFVDPGLEKFLIDQEVEISAVPIREGSGFGALLLGFGPAILIIAFYVWLYRRAAQGGGMGLGGIMGIGRSKARRYDQSASTKVTFDDVAGIDQHPIALGLALDAGAAIAFLFELPDELVGDGPDMPLRTPRSEDHMIADRGLAPQVDAGHVFCLGGVERAEHDIEQAFRIRAE